MHQVSSTRTRFSVAALAMLLVACSAETNDASPIEGSQERQVSTAAPGTETREGARPNATRVLGAAEAGCPLTGAWQLCSVEDRLVRAGLAPQRADSAPAPRGGSSATARYWLGGVEVQVYLFDSASGREAAERELGEPPLLESAVGAPRTLVSSANLAAVLHGFQPRQVERVELALSGGLPDG